MRSWDETRIERIRRLQMKGEQKTRTEDQDLNLDNYYMKVVADNHHRFRLYFVFVLLKER